MILKELVYNYMTPLGSDGVLDMLGYKYEIPVESEGVLTDFESYLKIWDALCVSLLRTGKVALLLTVQGALPYKR